MNTTKRQEDVLAWALQGLTNKQIAKRLNIGESTVKAHMTALLRKYAVQNRLQLIAFAKQGVSNTIVPVEIEQVPFAWIKTSGAGVKGFVVGATKPAEGWEPVYTRRTS